MLYIYIQEVLASNLDWDINYPDFSMFTVFFPIQANSPVVPQPGMAISFQIFSNSSLILPTDITEPKYSHHHKINVNK
jgi:hypothetical protein